MLFFSISQVISDNEDFFTQYGELYVFLVKYQSRAIIHLKKTAYFWCSVLNLPTSWKHNCSPEGELSKLPLPLLALSLFSSSSSKGRSFLVCCHTTCFLCFGVSSDKLCSIVLSIPYWISSSSVIVLGYELETLVNFEAICVNDENEALVLIICCGFSVFQWVFTVLSKTHLAPHAWLQEIQP